MGGRPNAESIFHEARAIPTGTERDAYLEKACSDDSGLRLMVDALLRAEEGAGAFLSDPEHDEEGSSAALRRLNKRSGEGRYKIVGEFARGGMGAILRVWDRELRRTLAMKVVLGQAEAGDGGTPPVDERILERFIEEAQVTGQLDHPGIVPVHEIGLDAEGKVFFTMRLVQGEDLKSVFEQLRAGEGGWTRARVLGVLLKVCEAMAYAHSKGVIHRDLKPANIMVGRFGEAYVMDWGLARVEGREDDKDIRVRPLHERSMTQVRTDRREVHTLDSPLITMDGDVIGTPAFMSPEQAHGDLKAMGPASDVYSLGAVLYELLAGHIPYVAPGVNLSAYAIWALAQEGPPKPVGLAAPDAPEELVAICDRAMAREPEGRYADMGEMAADVQAFVEGRVVRAHRTGAVIEFKKWVSRNRSLAASSAAALVFAITGLLVISFVQSHANTDLAAQNTLLEAARSLAEDNEADAKEATARAEAAGESLKSSLADVVRERDQKDAQYRRADGLRLSIESRRMLDEDPVTALLLATEAHRLHPGQTDPDLRAAMDVPRPLLILPEAARLDPMTALTPDGARIAWFTSEVIQHLDIRSREIETVHLDRKLHPLSRMSGSHSSAPRLGMGPVVFSPDTTRMLVQEPDQFRVFDTSTGDQLFAVDDLAEGNRPSLLRARGWSPGGRFIITATHVHDGYTGVRIPLELRSNSFAFGQDDSWLAVTSGDRAAEHLSVRVWDLSDSTKPVELPAAIPLERDQSICAVDVATERVLTYGDSLVLHQLPDNEPLLAIDDHHSAAALSRCGRYVASWSGSIETLGRIGTLRLWDVTQEFPEAQSLRTLPPRSPSSAPGEGALIFSPDSTVLVSVDRFEISAWSVPEGVLLRKYRRPTLESSARNQQSPSFTRSTKLDQIPTGAGFSDDGRRFWDGTSLYDMQPARRVSIPVTADNGVPDELFSSMGNHSVSGLGTRVISTVGRRMVDVSIHDLETGARVGGFEDEERTSHVAFLDHAGEQLLCVSGAGVRITRTGSAGEVSETLQPAFIRVRDVVSGRRTLTIECDWTIEDFRLGRTGLPAVTPNGQRLLLFEAGGARVLDTGDGTLVSELGGSGATTRSAVFGPYGELVAAISDDRTVRVWDVETGSELHSVQNDTLVNAVAFGPDGGRLAIAAETGLWIWDLQSDSRLACASPVPAGVAFDVTSITWSPDGDSLVAEWERSRSDQGLGAWRSATGARGWDLSSLPPARVIVGGSGYVARSAESGSRVFDIRSGAEFLSIPGEEVLSFVEGDSIRTIDALGVVRVRDVDHERTTPPRALTLSELERFQVGTEEDRELAREMGARPMAFEDLVDRLKARRLPVAVQAAALQSVDSRPRVPRPFEDPGSKAPFIVTVKPRRAIPGRVIQVNGSDFEPGLTVSLGGVVVVPTSVTTDKITFDCPRNVPIDARLIITNPNGRRDAASFNSRPRNRGRGGR